MFETLKYMASEDFTFLSRIDFSGSHFNSTEVLSLTDPIYFTWFWVRFVLCVYLHHHPYANRNCTKKVLLDKFEPPLLFLQSVIFNTFELFMKKKIHSNCFCRCNSNNTVFCFCIAGSSAAALNP